MKELAIREVSEIVNPNDHHMALMFVLDTSSSMEGKKIAALNAGWGATVTARRSGGRYIVTCTCGVELFGGEAETLEQFTARWNSVS